MLCLTGHQDGYHGDRSDLNDKSSYVWLFSSLQDSRQEMGGLGNITRTLVKYLLMIQYTSQEVVKDEEESVFLTMRFLRFCYSSRYNEKTILKEIDIKDNYIWRQWDWKEEILCDRSHKENPIFGKIKIDHLSIKL